MFRKIRAGVIIVAQAALCVACADGSVDGGVDVKAGNPVKGTI